MDLSKLLFSSIITVKPYLYYLFKVYLSVNQSVHFGYVVSSFICSIGYCKYYVCHVKVSKS